MLVAFGDKTVKPFQKTEFPISCLPQLLIHKCKDRGGDADDDECRDGTPDGVGLGELPDGEDAEDGACDERDGNHNERDPADNIRTDYTARFGLQFYDHVGIISLHTSIITKGDERQETTNLGLGTWDSLVGTVVAAVVAVVPTSYIK